MSTCILAQRRGLWVNKISRMHCATLQCCVPNKGGVCLSIFSSAGFGTRFEQTLQTRASAKAKWASLRCSWQNRGQANLQNISTSVFGGYVGPRYTLVQHFITILMMFCQRCPDAIKGTLFIPFILMSCHCWKERIKSR